jgi:hypothetical protein
VASDGKHAGIDDKEDGGEYVDAAYRARAGKQIRR